MWEGLRDDGSNDYREITKMTVTTVWKVLMKMRDGRTTTLATVSTRREGRELCKRHPGYRLWVKKLDS